MMLPQLIKAVTGLIQDLQSSASGEKNQGMIEPEFKTPTTSAWVDEKDVQKPQDKIAISEEDLTPTPGVLSAGAEGRPNPDSANSDTKNKGEFFDNLSRAIFGKNYNDKTPQEQQKSVAKRNQLVSMASQAAESGGGEMYMSAPSSLGQPGKYGGLNQLVSFIQSMKG